MSSPTMYYLGYLQRGRDEDPTIGLDPMTSLAFNQDSMYFNGPLSMHQPGMGFLHGEYRRHGSPDSSSQQSSELSGSGEFDASFPPTPPAAAITSPPLGHHDPHMFNNFHLSGVPFTVDPSSYIDPNMGPTLTTFDTTGCGGGYNPMDRGFSIDSYSSYDEPRKPAQNEILASQHNLVTQTSSLDNVASVTSPTNNGSHLPTTPVSASGTPAPANSVYPPPEDSFEVDQDLVGMAGDDPNDEDYPPEKKYARGHKRKPSTQASHRSHKRTKTVGMMSPTSPPSTPVVETQRRLSHPSRIPGMHHPLSSPHVNPSSLQCPDCPGKTYKDKADLVKHQRQQHTRPFVCVFDFAGCGSTFASKNEWKRHVQSQHLLLNYWLCQEGSCAKVENTHCEAIPRGAIFNRKDLYTQHIRRMHTARESNMAARKRSGAASSSSSSSVSSKKAVLAKGDASPFVEERLKQLQSEAHKERCKLPTRMSCPVANCNQDFTGSGAWDDRMEHVAKHLERSANRRAEGFQGHDVDEVVFGGPNDVTLLTWAARDEVAVIRQTASGAFELWNPLKGEPGPVGAGTGRKNNSSNSSSGNHGSSNNNNRNSQYQQVSTAQAVPAIESGDEDAEGEEE